MGHIVISVFGNDKRASRRDSLQSRVQLFSELPPKFRELARTDSLPDTPHGVKEERQIVMRQQNAAEHLAGQVKMTNKRARMSATN